MKRDFLKQEINLALLTDFFDRHASDFCALIALVFFTSPIIEMVICLFNRTERIYPISVYPRLILNIVNPAAVILGVCTYLGIIHTVRRKKARLASKLQTNRLYAWFLMMALWMLLATIVNHKPLFDIIGNSYRSEPIGLLLSYFLVYLFCASFIEEDRKEWLSLVTVLLSVLLGVYSSIRYALVMQGREFSIQKGYAMAVFANSNHYGYYLAVHILLASGLYTLSKRSWVRCASLAALIYNTAVLSYNNTFGAWLACLAAFVFQIVVLRVVDARHSKRSWIALGAFLIMTLLMSIWTNNVFSSITQFLFDIKRVLTDPKNADRAGASRWIIWKVTVKKIGERPLFGFGNEGIDNVLREATCCSRPHNEILQYAAFFGIPAALMYVSGVMHVFIAAWRHRAKLQSGTLICLFAAFAYFVSALFGNTMHYTAPFYFLFLGMAYTRE